MMAARKQKRGKPRYGLAVVASTGSVELTACVTTRIGTLRPIVEDELQREAPEWHAVLLYCRAGRKVHEALAELPPSVRDSAAAFLQIMSLFGRFDDSPLLSVDSPQAGSSQTQQADEV